MNRFRRTKNQMSFEINTASLPDLVFTVLFFFMITTHFQTVPNQLKIDVPTATELQKLQERSLIIYIMVGKEGIAGQARNDNGASQLVIAGLTRNPLKEIPNLQIQLNNEIITLEQLPEKLQNLKNNIPEADHTQLTTILKMDRNTPMGLVSDIKNHLRKAEILTIHYSANRHLATSAKKS
ncbi:biopolymer transporter ExbD [Bacteroidia bacterium]|nr:biopolymer transporter ExbD [Bacteroidia bacterium]